MKLTFVRALVPVFAALVLCGCPEKQGEGKPPETPSGEQPPETQPLPEHGDDATSPPAEDKQQPEQAPAGGAPGGGW